MQFTKYNNPSRKKRSRRSGYSQEYIEARRMEMYQALAGAETESEKDIITKAFSVSVNV